MEQALCFMIKINPDDSLNRLYRTPMTDDLLHRIRVLETQVALLTHATLGEGEDAEADVGLADLSGALSSAITALAPLQALLSDDTVNDILINGPAHVYVERDGRLEKTGLTFASDADVFSIAKAIATQMGRRLDGRRPLLDARLPDGSRVNVVAPPLAVDGTVISIRKFARRSITLDDMRDQGNLSAGLAEFLKVIALSKLNIVISGGTGSGKTTLLNAISQFIGADERIVTIEDAAELRLQQPHVVRLETRPMQLGRQAEEVGIRDLMRNALRMRPDRIIVGEVRGPEAFDMMQAMNTGHEGSLTTIHANHPRDAVARLENMINMANLNLPSMAIREQIASAIHLIVQISRMRDGQRRVAFVSELVGMEGNMVTMQDVFVFQTKGEGPDGKVLGEFKWTGIMPRFLRRVAYYGQTERLSAAFGVKLPKM